ncbi:MAG: hypothetical protein DWQ10_16540 [Calditrichaeota bacterium]|nr:MAG: hypothetical protein DWQ10_16540 [Calditrichota bacterium]
MNLLFFIISEGFAGIRRSKFSAILTILSLLITLTLLNIYFLISQNILQRVGELKGQIAVEAFIEEGLSEEDIAALRTKILNKVAIDSVVYLSKENALLRFADLFGDDYDHIVEENPLPASFQIKIKIDETELKITDAIEAIEKLDGIDEVVFHKKLITAINYFASSLRRNIHSIGFGLIVFCFGLLWINITITMNSKARLIETMLLVGAKHALIRWPFYVQSMVEGVIAGVGSIIILYFIQINFNIKSILHSDTPYLLPILIIFISLSFSFVTCFITIRRRI